MPISKYHIDIKIIMLAMVMVAVNYLLQANVDINLSDEGFLWYGVQRVLQGEVPIRDFMSYDPGRYYLSATIMHLFGNNGISGLRITYYIIQFIALFAVLHLLSIHIPKPNTGIILLASVVFIFWMFQRHKLFDITVSIVLTYSLTQLFINTSNRQFLLSGILLGIIATIGRNHGVYGLLATIGITIWLSIGSDIKTIINYLFYWIMGVVIGYSPIILMLIFIPEFYSYFIESIIYLFKVKATNLSLPIPWPWTIDILSLSTPKAIHEFTLGLYFVVILLFPIVVILASMNLRLNGKEYQPILVASAFLAIPYSHIAFSRADLAHLSQAIFPFLTGLIIFLSNRAAGTKWIGLILLIASSLTLTYKSQPLFKCLPEEKCSTKSFTNSEILIPNKKAEKISVVNHFIDKYSTKNDFLIIPFDPAIYAINESKSPTRDIYPIKPRDDEFQRSEILRIETSKPKLIIVNNRPIDNRDELRFRNSNPLIFNYIKNHYYELNKSPVGGYEIYIANREKR